VILELRGARTFVTAPQVDRLGYTVPSDIRLVDAPPGSGNSDPGLYPRLESSLPSRGPRAHASADCLIDFVDLHYLPEEQFRKRVLALTRRWGLLWICQHREPAGRGCVEAVGRWCPPLGWIGEDAGFDYLWEPLEAWRRYSRQIDAILRVATNLRDGRPGDSRNWEAIAAAEPSALPMRKALWTPRHMAGDVGLERLTLGAAVQRWLQFGDVVADVIWRPDEPAPVVRLSHTRLTGILAVQLAAAVQSQEGIYICAECGRPFTLPAGARRRARDRDAYCSRPTCGRKAVVRNSQRRRYHKKAAHRGSA